MTRVFRIKVVRDEHDIGFEDRLERAIVEILEIKGAVIGSVKTFYSEGVHVAHISYQESFDDKEKDDDKQV